MGGKLKASQLEGLEWLVSLFNNNLNCILRTVLAEYGLRNLILTHHRPAPPAGLAPHPLRRGAAAERAAEPVAAHERLAVDADAAVVRPSVTGIGVRQPKSNIEGLG